MTCKPFVVESVSVTTRESSSEVPTFSLLLQQTSFSDEQTGEGEGHRNGEEPMGTWEMVLSW